MTILKKQSLLILIVNYISKQETAVTVNVIRAIAEKLMAKEMDTRNHEHCKGKRRMSIYERSKKMKQLSLEDINLDMIPINVLQDVDKRIADWRAAGGKDSDAYIQNQLRYLKRVELMANNATDTLTYF